MEIESWLLNISQAINEINLFLTDKKDFYAFQRDLKTKRAIERNIEIIGEEVNIIVETKPDIAITNERKNRRY